MVSYSASLQVESDVQGCHENQRIWNYCLKVAIAVRHTILEVVLWGICHGRSPKSISFAEMSGVIKVEITELRQQSDLQQGTISVH